MSKLAKATSTESIEELGLNGSNAAKRLQAMQATNFSMSSVNLISSIGRILCLLEQKISDNKVNSIIDKLGFDFSHRIEVIGFSREIWVG